MELNLIVLRAMRRKVISRAPREDVCELTILDRESVERVCRAFVFVHEFVEVSLRNG
jgi:malonyl CoA-acyl carrier protein transacylase